MKKFMKTIALIIAAVMLSGLTALTALSAPADGNDKITVSLRIEGIEEPLYYNSEIRISSGATVADLLATVNEMENSPEIKILDGAYGSYVSEIGDLEEFTYGPMSGWSYRINGLSPTFGISMCELGDGDEVVCFFGDPFGIGMQYPVPDLSRLLSGGIIKFTSIDSTFDEDWIEILTENPVKSALVTFDRKIYTTDENGEILIADKTGLSGFHTLQIERYDDETGTPTVLRLAPDYAIYTPFTDTPDGVWYDDAIMFCVRDGYFVGTNAALNLFAPLDKMNMVQLVTVLARIGGVGAELTTGRYWYREPLWWAVDTGLLVPSEEESAALKSDDGIDAFYGRVAGMNVTRETFITMFYRTAALAGGYDMTVRADITGATDYDDINEADLEAISWAVAAGIIRGTGVISLTIDPAMEINRAMVCQMLYNYYY